MIYLLTLLLLSHPHAIEPGTRSITFDCIDFNKTRGVGAIDQVIFWRYCRADNLMHSYGYAMQDHVIGRVRDENGYKVLLISKDNGRTVWKIRAAFVIETETTFDPEVADRKHYPHIDRRWK